MHNNSDIRPSEARIEPRADGRGKAERESMQIFRIAVATAGFYLFLIFGTLAFGIAALLFSWLPPRGNWVFRCARGWSRWLLAFSGVTVDRVGGAGAGAKTHQPPVGIFMANHQSLFDIPALILTLPGQSRFMAKRSLFYIPIFGWALAVGGFVPVDRQNRRAGSRTLEASAQRLASGASIVIFPEETRSRDGHLLPFKTGGIVLAIQAGADIIPVGIRGAYDVRCRGSWLVRPGKIRVHYGAKIACSEFDLRDRKELVQAVRERVADLSGQSA